MGLSPIVHLLSDVLCMETGDHHGRYEGVEPDDPPTDSGCDTWCRFMRLMEQDHAALAGVVRDPRKRLGAGLREVSRWYHLVLKGTLTANHFFVTPKYCLQLYQVYLH